MVTRAAQCILAISITALAGCKSTPTVPVEPFGQDQLMQLIKQGNEISKQTSFQWTFEASQLGPNRDQFQQLSTELPQGKRVTIELGPSSLKLSIAQLRFIEKRRRVFQMVVAPRCQSLSIEFNPKLGVNQVKVSWKEPTHG